MSCYEQEARSRKAIYELAHTTRDTEIVEKRSSDYLERGVDLPHIILDHATVAFHATQTPLTGLPIKYA
jgi:hypothetical protein